MIARIQIDWTDALEQKLIDAGLTGIDHSDILRQFDRRYSGVTADDITAHLEALQSEQKVQSFSIPTRGRPKRVWRATTELLKDV